jgi:hypothetical protein
MSLHDDLASDYTLREDVETVSVQDVSSLMTTTDASVSAIMGNPLVQESNGSPAAGPEVVSCQWTLFVKSLSFVPMPGDVITAADGTKWTIATIQTIAIGTVDYQYICETRKQ